jgi:hypothetical protein
MVRNLTQVVDGKGCNGNGCWRRFEIGFENRTGNASWQNRRQNTPLPAFEPLD